MIRMDVDRLRRRARASTFAANEVLRAAQLFLALADPDAAADPVRAAGARRCISRLDVHLAQAQLQGARLVSAIARLEVGDERAQAEVFNAADALRDAVDLSLALMRRHGLEGVWKVSAGDA